MIAEARRSVDVDEPGAQRGEGAFMAGDPRMMQVSPPTTTTIHGVPVSKIVEDMKNAGLSDGVVARYLKHAAMGNIVPPHTHLLGMGRKGRSGNGTP